MSVMKVGPRDRSRRRKPRPLTGTVAVPGDKSITHRALIVAALARGRSTVLGANLGADARATARALTALGARCTVAEPSLRVEVEGCGWDGLHEPADVIDCGNSGTLMRTLLGVVAAVPGATVLTGDDSLRSRPMLRVVAPLRQMGASIDGRDHGNRAPLFVRGTELTGIDHELPVASAQVKTALLLAGMRASGTTVVVEPRPSRDHTERMLRDAGIPVRATGGRVEIDGGGEPVPFGRKVPGDFSSALFLVAAALMVEGSDLAVTGVGLNPTRTEALDVLREMGADLDVELTGETGGEPVGAIRARTSRLTGVEIAPERIPALIDEIPILAIVASQAEGTTAVRGAGELRLKESDRIDAIARGLASLGSPVEPLPDGLVIKGPVRLGGGRVDSLGDHRIAMAFAVAGLVADSGITVEGWSCVETSFPGFLDTLGEAQRGRP